MADAVAGDFQTSSAKTKNQDDDVARKIQRPLNCLHEENKNVRKKALADIRQIVAEECHKEENLGILTSDHFINSHLKVFSDPVEQCRHLSISIIFEIFATVPNPDFLLIKIFPTLVKRLAQQDIVEPSEEIRLQLLKFLEQIIQICKKKVTPFVNDVVKILQQTITDTYPEIRKCSCECASLVAATIPEQFYHHSEMLIKPLLLTVTHQHSKVRALVIQTIGTVIQYGNGKSVDDVVSHLAQRLFDPVPSVRMAVIQTVGGWLLDLPDRYSYQPKLIPLLLSGFNDEILEVREEAEGLWHDIGMKYESENENDLKDKIDFMKPAPDHYPKHVKRPNLGCRQLVYNHYSKILPAIVNDMADWNADTRLQAAKLLYVMLVNEENNITQHLDKTLLGLYKACCDEESKVVDFVMKSSELIGYFVDVDIWCKMIVENIKISQSHGSIFILAHVITGSQAVQLQSHLPRILQVISDPGICQVAEVRIQEALLMCIESILDIVGDESHSVAYQMFSMLLYILALHRREKTKIKSLELLEKLSSAEKMPDRNTLIRRHAQNFLDQLRQQSGDWLSNSPQLLAFGTLIHLADGSSLEHCLGVIMEICSDNLKTSKSADLRHTSFALLSHIMMSKPSLFSREGSGDLVLRVVGDMILPNCVWTAGRTSEVLRKSAISCLWTVLDLELLSREQFEALAGVKIVNQLRSLLEDENRGTRLTTCHTLSKIFSIFGDSLEKNSDLYNLYPDLLKRLDDGNDDVRSAASETFSSYLSCLRPDYNVSLYSAHLEEIFKGLLIHLDDPNQKIQEAILSTLMKNASLSPEMLLKLTDDVRLKHRSTEYCDSLIRHIHSLPKPS